MDNNVWFIIRCIVIGIACLTLLYFIHLESQNSTVRFLKMNLLIILLIAGGTFVYDLFPKQ